MRESSGLIVVYRECDAENEQWSCDGRGVGGEQRHILRDNKPKKMGARSARALFAAETR
jgi:hypothetical protein